MAKMTTAPAEPKTFPANAIDALFAGVVWVVVSVLLSVLLEWTGLALGWWDRNHSAEILRNEVGLVASNHVYPMAAFSPIVLGTKAIAAVNQKTAHLQRWIYRQQDKVVYQYIAAAINIIKLTILKGCVCLSLAPAYAVVGMAALVDGLIRRDMRKFTGGRESAYVFHRAKNWLMPSIALTVSVYLISPFSIPPALVFLPSLLGFALAVYYSASRFKKYL